MDGNLLRLDACLIRNLQAQYALATISALNADFDGKSLLAIDAR